MKNATIEYVLYGILRKTRLRIIVIMIIVVDARFDMFTHAHTHALSDIELSRWFRRRMSLARECMWECQRHANATLI